VLHDRATGRCHRLTPSAYQLAGSVDGRHTVHEVWQRASARLGDDGPTQDETIQLLGMLHAADLLRCDVSPDVEELFRRACAREHTPWWQRASQLLAIRIPLADPDPLLARWAPSLEPLFTRSAAWLLGLLIAIGIVIGILNLEEIARGGPDTLFDRRGLLLLWLTYPVVKALHELAHALATRVWGGEVHEVGIVMLLLVPIPYVDASSSWAFPEKRRRIAVGAAGIAVELALATLALLVWLSVEPGWVRDGARTVFWIGGLSTLLFNGNPLLRFDGYYVLADALEIPNLYGRSRQYLASLVQRHLFGMAEVDDPVSAPGEAGWLFVYGIASSVYRFAVQFGIAIYLAQRLFVVGVLLAIASVVTGILAPAAKQLAFLFSSPRLGAQRPRAWAVSGGFAAALAVTVFALPLPMYTIAQGVVWPPEDTQLRSGSAGIVEAVLVETGASVAAGQPVLVLQDPGTRADLAVLDGRLRELDVRRNALLDTDRARARMMEGEIAGVERARQRARERIDAMVVRSPRAGRLVLRSTGDLVGRFVEQGESLGWVLGEALRTVRVVVPQSDAALVRRETRDVAVRIADRIAEVHDGQLEREIPGATSRLPAPALGTSGGGPFAVSPDESGELIAEETVFQFDVEIEDPIALAAIGLRAYVRFDHGTGSLARRLERSLRQLFLRRLGA
jgi:putative peptide zinc metalloprotease protein